MVLGVLQSLALAPLYNVFGSRAHFLDVAYPEHRVCQQRIGRERLMGAKEFLHREAIGQLSGVPHLQAVAEQHHLHTGIAGVVAVAHGIYNSLFHRLVGQFILGRHSRRFSRRTGSGPVINAAHHKRCGLVNHLEHGAAVNLVAGQRFFDHIAIELHTLDLGGDEEPLRALAKQEDGGIGNASPFVHQREMGEQARGRCVQRQREITLLAGHPDELGHLVLVQVIQRCVGVESRIKRLPTDILLLLQIAHQRSVDRCPQSLNVHKSLAHDVALHLFYKGRLLGMSVLLIEALDEYQSCLMQFCRTVILAFGRRHALGILVAVFVAVKTQIDVAHLHLAQVHLLWRSLIGGHILEQKSLEKLPQQGIRADVLAEHGPLLRELALHAANEDFNPFHDSSYP